MGYYEIPIQDIKERVAKKNGRNRQGEAEQLYLEGTIHTNVKRQVNEFGEEIIRVDGEIPVDLPVKNEQRFLFISYDQTILSHGLHKYPAKFFPELPRWLIKRYSKEYQTIVDPFAGSATTNVEALLNRRHSVAIDVDPFSRFLARVKVTPLDDNVLEESLEELLNRIVIYSPSLVDEKDIPVFPYKDNWFNKEMILELAYIRKIIDNLGVDQDLKDFYKICFSSIIRSVSNADDNCTRTVIRKKLRKKVYPSGALTRFAESILLNVPKMQEFSKRCPSDIRVEIPSDCDARCIMYPDGYFDLAVTSPPYANAVDYPRTHQLEIYWLGFEGGSLSPLKRKHVGTESVTAKEYNSLHTIGVAEADKVISKIYEKDPRRAYIAYKYLEDIEKNLREVYRVLSPGSNYVIVVGNNRIRGEVFQNWVYLMALAQRAGFSVENYFASEIIRHFIKVPREERINTDWILVLSKPHQ